MRPVAPARVSQPFADPGFYASRSDSHGRAGHHTGIDFGSAWPIPIANRLVRSVLDGVVVISEYNSTMGHWVGVYSPAHDITVTYWHMTNRKVQVGDEVRAYQPLGNVGSTGNSTAPHLHVQVNQGRGFDYHGHINPHVAFKVWRRRHARRRFRRLRSQR